MQFLRRSLTGLFLLSMTAGLLVYAGTMVSEAIQERMARDTRSPQARERVFAVNVETAVPGTVAPEIVVFGEIKSARSLEIRAATGGTVIRLAENFVEGGRVEAGQVLAQVDPRDAQAAVDRITNDLRDAEFEARDAARQLDIARDDLSAAREQAKLRDRALQRQIDLRERGVGTETAVETAELAAASARQAVLSRRQALAQAEARGDQAVTRLERTRIALEEAKRALERTTITADFAGTLSSVSVVEGRLVSPNEKLATLIDDRLLEVAFRVSTPQYARLLDENGDLRPARVMVSLDVMGTDLQSAGTIARDAAAVGEGQTGRQIFATLDETRGLKPGDFVTVRVREAPLENVIRLPATAMDAAERVLVLGENDRLESVGVRLLRRQGDQVLVRSDALAGREFVRRQTPLLGAGILVKPLRRQEGGEAAAPLPDTLMELSDERRARLLAFVEANNRMPTDVKERLISALQRPRVPISMVERLESRMGG